MIVPDVGRSPAGGDPAQLLREDGHDKPFAFDWTMRRMIGDVTVKDATVLDIGSGRGLTSLWLALHGARRVVSMEPEREGARSGAVELQRRRVTQLKLDQVEIVTADFQHYQPSEPFDLIVSNASINHLKESEHHALRHRQTFDDFVGIATQIRSWLKPDGVAIVTDACRYGFFTLARNLGLPKRLCYHCKTIDYKLHQNPHTWKTIFTEAGFSRLQIDYPFPYPLRAAKPLLNNAAANFFLQASLILRAFR